MPFLGLEVAPGYAAREALPGTRIGRPLVSSAILPHADAEVAARTIINRYELTGGAEAVRDVLSPAGGAGTDVSVIGAVLLVIAVLSFSREVQWPDPGGSVRPV